MRLEKSSSASLEEQRICINLDPKKKVRLDKSSYASLEEQDLTNRVPNSLATSGDTLATRSQEGISWNIARLPSAAKSFQLFVV